MYRIPDIPNFTEVENMYCESNCGSTERRSFLTREERVELLKDYRETLQQEMKGVSEKIEELEKKRW